MVYSQSIYNCLSPNIVTGIEDNVNNLECPHCEKKTIKLYPNPQNRLWCVCESCGYSGDVLTYLQTQYKTATLAETFAAIDKAGNLTSEITADMIQDYGFTQDRRRLCLRLFDDAAAQFYQDGPKCFKILQLGGLNVVGANSASWTRAISQSVGMVRISEVKQYLPDFKGVKSDDDIGVLFPYFAAPGLPSAFAIYYLHKAKLKRVDFPLYRNLVGLHYGSPAALATAEYVIAHTDPFLALRASENNNFFGTEGSSIISYFPGDGASWVCLRGLPIIFWAEEPSIELYKQAKCVPNSRVCLSSAGVSCSQIANVGTAAWAELVQQYSSDWPTSLVLATCGLDRHLSLNMLAAIKLSRADRQRVIKASETLNVPDVKSYINMLDTIVEVEFDGHRITEHDGGWIADSLASRRQQMTDFTIVLDKTITYAGLGSYFCGRIRKNDAIVPFQIPVAAAHDSDWVETLLLENGLGKPYINKRWRTRLIDVAYALSPAAGHVQTSAKIGWTDDRKEFMLPSGTLRNGQFVKTGGIPADMAVPGSRISSLRPSKNTLSELTVPTDSNRAFWAAALAICVNIRRRFDGNEAKKIGILADPGFVRMFARALDLVPIEFASASGIADSEDTVLLHDLPALFEIKRYTSWLSASRWLNDSTDKNLLLSLNPVEAVSLASDNNWLFVDAREQELRLTDADRLWNLLPMLIETAAHQIPERSELRFELCSLLKNSVSSYLNQPCQLFDRVPSLLRDGSPWGPVGRGILFLYTLYELLDVGAINYTHEGVAGASNKAVVCGRDKVLIYKKVMKHIPNIEYRPKNEIQDALSAMGILETAGPGYLAISRVAWDRYYGDWLVLN